MDGESKDGIDEVVRAVAAANIDSGAGLLVVTSGSSPTVVPVRPVGVMRYMGVHISTEDYFPIPATASRRDEHLRAIEVLSNNNNRETMLQVLAELASTIAQAPLMADLIEGFRAFLGQLGAQYLANFDSAMGQHEGRRSFLGRELLLAATRVVLSQPDPTSPQQKVPPHMAMLMLSHAIAALNELDDERADDGPTLVGFPEELALDMVCNQAFHDQDDIYSVLDRQLRMWNVLGPQIAPKLGGKTPEELLQEATGLSVKDFLALGLALYAHFLGWKPGQPARLLDDFSSEMPENTKQRFRELVAATTDDLASQCTTPSRSKWDFLFLQAHPVLQFDTALLVLDGPFLFDRFTSGLYWLVHDHLKAQDELSRQHWTQAWGDMVEAMAIEDLRPHAPIDLTGRSTFFDEHDVEAAYPNGGNADVVIDLGEGIGVFEIVSHRLTVPTRISGRRTSFDSDMEACVFKKVRQLNDTVRSLVQDPERLIPTAGTSRPIQPVVVTGEGFPTSPITCRYIDEYCETNNLLAQEDVRQLCVIDIGDLECLEGLVQHHGHSLLEILDEWKQSDLAENIATQLSPRDISVGSPCLSTTTNANKGSGRVRRDRRSPDDQNSSR